MHPISDKELDKLFQKNFGDMEIEPGNAVWNNISDQLDNQNGGKKSFSMFWMAAAGVVVVLSAGLWFFRPVETIKLQGQAQNKVEVVPEPVIPEPAKEVANAPIKDNQSSDFVVIAPELSEVSKTESSEIKSQEFIQVPEDKEVITAAVVQKNEPVVIRELKAKAVLPELNSFENNTEIFAVDQMLAQSDDAAEDIQSEDQDYTGQRKIKSIGSLVNFVIAKVDRRENKIIEFKDGDEGSELAGLNLGIVKYRNRK